MSFIVLVPNQKRPYTPGQRHLYVEFEELDVWLRRGFNVGTCGDSALMLDFDDEPGRIELFTQLGPLVLTVQTPRGGHHCYFKPQVNFGPATITLQGRVIGQVKRLPSEYCVRPPSRSEKGNWTWLSSGTDVPDVLPDAWQSYLYENNPEPSPTDVPGERFRLLEEIGEGVAKDIGSGDRHRTLFRLARSMKARGYPDDVTLQLCARVNAVFCKPPLNPPYVQSYIWRVLKQPDRFKDEKQAKLEAIKKQIEEENVR